jgi:hypothetical protein
VDVLKDDPDSLPPEGVPPSREEAYRKILLRMNDETHRVTTEAHIG